MTELSRSWSPYAYTYDNPCRFIDPTGMWTTDADGNYSTSDADEIRDFLQKMEVGPADQGQRRKALERARRFVDEKPADSNSYLMGAKGKPGERVDCSGMASDCIVAGGEKDPNFPTKDFNGHGVSQIEHNTQKINDEKQVVKGNLVTFYFPDGTWTTHIGMISEIWHDKDGKTMDAKTTIEYNRLLDEATIAEKKGLNNAAALDRNLAQQLKTN